MNQKGIAHLLILFIGLAAVAGFGYFIFKSIKNGSDLGQSNQGLEIGGGDEMSESWEAYEASRAALEELEWLENYIENNDVIYDEDEQAADFEMTQEQVENNSQAILLSSYCGANLEDVRNSLQAAAQAQSVGLEDLGDKLIEWAKNAYMSSLSVVAPSWADNPSEEAMYDWLYYWRLSGMLGMEDIMDSILQGHIDIFSWLIQNCPTVGEGVINGTPLDKQIEILLAKDYCKANIDDVKEGLILVERIQLLGKERDEEVFEWSQNAFTAIVAKNHEDWDAQTRFEHAGIAEMLGLQSLSDDLKTNNVNLDDWLEQHCEKKGAYSITFGDQTYTKTIADITQTYKITNAKAHTCEGIFSRWTGTMDFSMELATPGYPAQKSEGSGSKFHFVLVDEESAKAGATLAQLEGNRITVWVPMSSMTDGGGNLVGYYSEGSNECN